MKKFILGTITGAAIVSTIGIAATYTAAPATFKVLVNGKEFTSDPPAMVINDRTYLPLRAIGDALGVSVNWNDELKQAEVGDTAYYQVNNTIPKYKTYEDNNFILDFGKLYNITPEQTNNIDGGYKLYKYDITNNVEVFNDYIDKMRSLGYTVAISDEDSTTFKKVFVGIDYTSNKTSFVLYHIFETDTNSDSLNYKIHAVIGYKI